MHTFTRWVPTPENRSAFLAVQRVADCIGSGRPRREINPLLIHGPAGTGKTHLVSALAGEVARRCPATAVVLLRADELGTQTNLAENSDEEGDCPHLAGLLIVEDLQHLAPAAAETL